MECIDGPGDLPRTLGLDVSSIETRDGRTRHHANELRDHAVARAFEARRRDGTTLLSQSVPPRGVNDNAEARRVVAELALVLPGSRAWAGEGSTGAGARTMLPPASR